MEARRALSVTVILANLAAIGFYWHSRREVRDVTGFEAFLGATGRSSGARRNQSAPTLVFVADPLSIPLPRALQLIGEATTDRLINVAVMRMATPGAAVEPLPKSMVDLRITTAAEADRFRGRSNTWLLFDSRGRKVSEGHLLTGGLVASVGRLVGTAPVFDDALREWLREPQTAKAALGSARNSVSGAATQLVVFVERANVTCPIGEVLAFFDSRLQRLRRSDAAVVVPSTWSAADIASFQATFGDRLPLRQLDTSLTHAWRRLVRSYGPAEAGAFIAVFVDRKFRTVYLQPQPLRAFVEELDKQS